MKDELKELFTESSRGLKSFITPATNIATGLVNMGVDAVGGLIQGDIDIARVYKNLISGNFHAAGENIKDIGNLGVNLGYGVIKSFTGLADLINTGLSKIPGQERFFGFGASMTEIAQRHQDAANRDIGASEKTARRGNALGDIVSILATGGGGTGAASKSALIKKTAAEAIFAELRIPESAEVSAKTAMDESYNLHLKEVNRSKTIGYTKWIEEQGYVKDIKTRRLIHGATGEIVDAEKYERLFMEACGSAMPKYADVDHMERFVTTYKNWTDKKSVYDPIKALAEEETKIKVAQLMTKAKNLRTESILSTESIGIVGSGIASGIVASDVLVASNQSNTTGNISSKINPIIPIGGHHNGGAMLKMGGVFDMGLQSRLVQMNIEMITHLVDIKKQITSLYTPPSTNSNNTTTGLF